ncbi:uncharacterized protein LOC118466393 isoform X4 [Anopheles albimanus]|uniref:uncharacterized protein LOC118466393 isoform X4 n=1 Tax=Anopheles albimanus TaxID=7167 RepID=UPI00163E0727|nr:uncharacterized protein LOC118466393 isoform X4 [Anopheles albimanus]XP_035791533.1 uncharacterized protein LOC118466393 isoform X4 [Anopheles albimanus]
MGKCASKQPAPGLNEFGSAPYLAICSDNDVLYINVGQSESKKSSKKADGGGVHTKGTAMSFGFKKHKSFRQQAATNATTAPASDGGGARTGSGGGGGGGALIETVPGAVANQIKKFNANGNVVDAALEREKAERELLVQATVISNPGVDAGFSDQNGNTGSVESVEDGGRTGGGRSTPRLQPAKKDSHGAPYRSNRFGFRTNNIVRPASAGLQPRVVANELDKHYSSSNNNNNNNNNVHPNNNNNNNVYITGDKRRSKSASSAASVRTTFTPVVPGGGGGGTGNAPPAAHQGGHAAMTLHQHAYGGGGGVLHRPQPKYQTANTKITHSTTTPASTGAVGDSTVGGSIGLTTGGTYQQPATKGEHKNTLRTVGGQSMATVSAQQQQQQQQHHQYTPASETGQSAAAPVAGTLHGKPPPAASKVGHQEQPLVASKFTLHSSSLPKPQYPVSISLTGTGSVGGPMAGNVTAIAPSARYTMDTKGAKHAVNVSRKEFAGMHASGGGGGGAGGGETPVPLEDTTTATTSSIRMPRQRYRSLEMVMSGRHKFEVRDLEALTTEPIVPLPLPELPSAFGSTANQRTAPLSGLIRSSELTASGLAGAASDGAPDDDDIDIKDNRYEVAEEEPLAPVTPRKNSQSEGESFEEEKLLRDKNSSEKSLKSAVMKEETQPPSVLGGSRVSWCDVQGEQSGRAAPTPAGPLVRQQQQQRSLEKEEEDVSSVTITAGHSSFSSMSAPVPMDMSLDMTNLDSVSEMLVSLTDPGTDPLPAAPAADRMYRNEQAKFAAMAAAISDVVLLEDETSPTDSLVSSCTDHSDDARKPAPRHGAKKGAEKTKEKEKDVDEISPDLDDLISPVSPGTPTHASNSLSLSDGGRDFLIDDEIADQPGLVFDEGSTIDVGSINLNLASQQTDTPTLKDSHNNRSTAALVGGEVTPKATPPVPKPRKILPEAYESPALSRKSARSNGRMARAESLDTLSPCDSIASDDFMLDFDCNSSIDSIDRAARSSVGGSATGLHSLDGLQLWNELENKGGHIIREWSTLLRSNPTPSGHNTSRESITSQLPARARLLTRRLQNNATPTNGSESPRSIDSLPRRTFSGSYKTATLSQFHNNLANNNGPGSLHLTDSASTATNSAEDLTLLDKSLRNSMLQDVVHFKKELVRLRRILQENEENLMMTDTLNPFENNNGQFFTTAAAAAVAACNNNNNSSSLSSAATDGQENSTASMTGLEMNRQQQENVLIRESSVAALALLEDQRQELADLRRQVVYLQGEMTAKDRIIRQQQNMIEKLEADREKQQQAAASATQSAATTNESASGAAGDINQAAETISTATQTERLRPVSFGGQEGLGSRSEHPTTPRNGLRTPTASNISSNSSGPSTPQQHLHSHHTQTPSRSAPSKTQISSVYTQLSSVRHSIAGASVPAISPAGTAPNTLRRTSVGSSHNLSSVGLSSNGTTKPVRTTHIGTLAVTGRQHTTGDRIPVSARHSSHHKLLASPIRSTVATAGPATSPSNGPPATAVNTNTGKRSASIIKPPSSFACNGGMLPMGETKSKSAPSTPSGAKLLTAPATGASTTTGGGCDDIAHDSNGQTTACVVLSSSDAGFSSGSCENESSGKSDTSDEGSETEKNTLASPPMPVNGKLLTSLKLLPSTGSTATTPAVAAGGGCGGDGASTLVPQPGHAANGIVGH